MTRVRNPTLAAKRVLLADDVPTMRMIVRGMLEEAGIHRIVEAEDGATAWEILHSSPALDPVDLAIVDWSMPGFSGLELLKAIRATSRMKDLPFVMISAKCERTHLSEAARAGVSEYLVKPFGTEQVREAVLRLLLPQKEAA